MYSSKGIVFSLPNFRLSHLGRNVQRKEFFFVVTQTVLNINFEGTDIRNKKYFLKGWTSYLMSNHVITFSILNLPR